MAPTTPSLTVVESTWAFEPALFHQCLSLHTDEAFTFDPDQISLADCWQFTAPSEVECAFELTLGVADEGLALTRLLWVSEAKLVELYDHQGRYLRTEAGQLLPDSDDDLRIYSLDIRLAEPQRGCQLKFRSLKRPACWILSCHAWLQPHTRARPPGGFDMGQINGMLDGLALSQNASQFKRFFESTQSTINPTGGAVGPLAGLPASSMAGLARLAGLASPAAPADGSPALTDRLQAMETRILARIEAVQREQDRKLDRILSLLPKNLAPGDT